MFAAQNCTNFISPCWVRWHTCHTPEWMLRHSYVHFKGTHQTNNPPCEEPEQVVALGAAKSQEVVVSEIHIRRRPKCQCREYTYSFANCVRCCIQEGDRRRIQSKRSCFLPRHRPKCRHLCRKSVNCTCHRLGMQVPETCH